MQPCFMNGLGRYDCRWTLLLGSLLSHSVQQEPTGWVMKEVFWRNTVVNSQEKSPYCENNFGLGF